jgi:hypothetical protein
MREKLSSAPAQELGDEHARVGDDDHSGQRPAEIEELRELLLGHARLLQHVLDDLAEASQRGLDLIVVAFDRL